MTNIEIKLERGIKELKAYLICQATAEEKKGMKKAIKVLEDLKRLEDQ